MTEPQGLAPEAGMQVSCVCELLIIGEVLLGGEFLDILKCLVPYTDLGRLRNTNNTNP